MVLKKKVVGLIKLQIVVGQVNFVLLVGFVFGQYGVNIMEFCKVYNVVMENQCGNVILVEIIVYEDCSFIFMLKMLFVVKLLFKVVGVVKGLVELYKIKVVKVIWD